MKIIRATNNEKCNLTNCKNNADYHIYYENSDKSITLCNDCIQDMRKCLSAYFAPITINPPFKNVKKLR